MSIQRCQCCWSRVRHLCGLGHCPRVPSHRLSAACGVGSLAMLQLLQLEKLMCWQVRCLPSQPGGSRNPPWYPASPQHPFSLGAERREVRQCHL